MQYQIVRENYPYKNIRKNNFISRK